MIIIYMYIIHVINKTEKHRIIKALWQFWVEVTEVKYTHFNLMGDLYSKHKKMTAQHKLM